MALLASFASVVKRIKRDSKSSRSRVPSPQEIERNRKYDALQQEAEVQRRAQRERELERRAGERLVLQQQQGERAEVARQAKLVRLEEERAERVVYEANLQEIEAGKRALREREERQADDERFVFELQQAEGAELARKEEKLRLEEVEVKKLLEREQKELEREQYLSCEICFGDFLGADGSEGDANEQAVQMIQCEDGHLVCLDCAEQNVKTRFSNQNPSLVCATGDCTAIYSSKETTKFLDSDQFTQLDKLRMQNDLLGVDGLVTCPSCSYSVIIEDDTLETLQCAHPACGKRSCLKCKKPDHRPKTCHEAYPAPIHSFEEQMSIALIRICPGKCKQPFVKLDGCNKINCMTPGCGACSCYICRASCPNDYSHWSITGTACYGKVHDDKLVPAVVELARVKALKSLTTDEERKTAALLK